MGKAEQIQLLAKMENTLHISSNDRLTTWFGDYSMWEAKPGVTMRQINKRIRDLDPLIEHTGSVKVQIQERRSRTIEVKNARSVQEAVEVIQDMYDQQDLVMNTDDIEEVEVQGVEMMELSNNRVAGEIKNRLFVDLDGTCAKWFVVAEEQLFEKGYYRNLPEYENVVAAVNQIVEKHPDIEVYVLSKYLTNSKYALQEKQEWVEEHMPGIDRMHRIFVPYEKDKRDMIPEGLRKTDYLLDDYTKNFENWMPPARGVKLLNGINHTRGSWQHDRLSLLRSPEEFADALIRIIEKGESIQDQTPQETCTEDYSKQIEEVMAQQEAMDIDMEM